jgi:hypothetical protein
MPNPSSDMLANDATSQIWKNIISHTLTNTNPIYLSK